jgi:hypothetical protein
MLPLSQDDLLSLEEYASRRREYFESHRRYLDRYRRVRVGPLATFVFENRQTLWFRVQEVLRIGRLSDPKVVQEELELFNRLLPGPGQLQAALLIEVRDESQLTIALDPWSKLSEEHIQLRIGNEACPGQVLTCRPEDRCSGAAHWIQFTLEGPLRKQLADFRQPALLEINLPAYSHQSSPLGDDMRQSLVDDLRLSEKTAVA